MPGCATSCAPRDSKSRSATLAGTCPWTRPSWSFRRTNRRRNQTKPIGGSLRGDAVHGRQGVILSMETGVENTGPSAGEALARLVAGNERFLRGEARHAGVPRETLADLARGQ